MKAYQKTCVYFKIDNFEREIYSILEILFFEIMKERGNEDDRRYIVHFK